jgi:hypothetical protein
VNTNSDIRVGDLVVLHSADVWGLIVELIVPYSGGWSVAVLNPQQGGRRFVIWQDPRWARIPVGKRRE